MHETDVDDQTLLLIAKLQVLSVMDGVDGSLSNVGHPAPVLSIFCLTSSFRLL